MRFPLGVLILVTSAATHDRTPVVGQPEPTLASTLLVRLDETARGPAPQPGGRALAFETEREGRWTIGLLDSLGARPRFLGVPFAARMPAWSPAGDELVVVAPGRDSSDLVVVSPTTGQWRGVLRLAGELLHPAWSPGGRTIGFGLRLGNDFGLRALDLASGRVTPLIDRDGRDLWPRWDATGRRMVFFSRRESPDDEVYVVDSAGATPRRLTTRAGHDFTPALSPSGNLVAVVSAVEASAGTPI